MGRGGLGVGGLVMMIIMLILINMRVNESARPLNSNSYIVGDEFGWDPTIDLETWPNGKTFYAGDTLEFKYNYQLYDVVLTDREGHDTCTVTANSTVLRTGDDRIQLQYGDNYFICSVATVCSGGLKMAISAQSPHQQPQL